MVWHFASGNAFFTGLTALWLAVACRALARGQRAVIISRILLTTGALMIALSSTPLWWLWYFALAAAVSGVWRAATVSGSRRQKVVAVLFASVATAVCLSIELSTLPVFTRSYSVRTMGSQPRSQTLYVIGDSLSELGQPSWPELLAERYHVHVVNLARAAATTKTALAQAIQIPGAPRALVLVEIGGNDQLSFRPASQFHSDLRELLQTLHHAGHHILMLELPLMPGQYAYGRAQRELAERFSIQLISKREFAAVLSRSTATIDGLHLSAEGIDALTERLASYLLPHLEPTRD